MAESSPLYAAARAASTNFLVVPLDGTSPLVEPSEATREPRRLLAWWQRWPEANPGIRLGRVGGALALRVEDGAAYGCLREMATVERHDDDDRSWKEYREIGGFSVRLVAPSKPFVSRSVLAWGKEYARAVNAMLKEDEQRQPETFFFVWSYPTVVSGADAFDYRGRRVGQGLTLIGEGDVLPWQGSILDGGIQVVAPMSRPPEVPLWLAKTIGKPRSRKAMAAAREQYEADQRAVSSHWEGVVWAQREAFVAPSVIVSASVASSVAILPDRVTVTLG